MPSQVKMRTGSTNPNRRVNPGGKNGTPSGESQLRQKSDAKAKTGTPTRSKITQLNTEPGLGMRGRRKNEIGEKALRSGEEIGGKLTAPIEIKNSIFFV
jgi:hypothetical protein